MNKITKKIWQKPKKLSNRHEEVIHLAVLGRSNAQIAAALGFTPQHIAKLMRSTLFQEKVKAERETRINSIVREKISGLSGLAIDSIELVLSSPDEKGSVKMDAAKFILEQIVGKAKGTDEPKTTNLVQFIQMIDALPKDATQQPKSKWDELINQIVPSDMVVGKRNA